MCVEPSRDNGKTVGIDLVDSVPTDEQQKEKMKSRIPQLDRVSHLLFKLIFIKQRAKRPALFY